MHKFNGGRGGAACDGCNRMLRDGKTVIRPHWELAKGHYCGWSCMLTHAQLDPPVSRVRALLLAGEAGALTVIDAIRAEVPPELVARLEGDLASKRVK